MNRTVTALKCSTFAASNLVLGACEQADEIPQSQQIAPEPLRDHGSDDDQITQGMDGFSSRVTLPEAIFYVEDHSACVATLQNTLIDKQDMGWTSENVDALCADISEADPGTAMVTVLTFAEAATFAEYGGTEDA